MATTPGRFADRAAKRARWSEPPRAVISSVYILSRGIAKSGSRSRAYDPREDLEIGKDDDRP